MGMSTHVIGFIPPDDRWRQMRAIYDACMAAEVDVPREVDEFFNGVAPDDHGQEVTVPHREWKDSHREGIEVELADLPPAVKTIRFYNSW